MYSNTTSNLTSLQPLLFDFSDLPASFSIELSNKEAEFAAIWNMVLHLLPSNVFERNSFGRRRYRLLDILAVRAVMLFFKQCNIRMAIEFMNGNPNIRRIVGLSRIPSESVISRRSRELLDVIDVDSMHKAIVSEFYSSRLVCNLSIDSTPIDAREKPIARETLEKMKKGRKKKGSEEERKHKERKAEKKRLEELARHGDVRQFLSTLEDKCSLTGKKNSKGHMQWRIGYKVHLAVDDLGIPVSFFVSGASVHDSRVAIPLLRLANERCTFLYSLMDGGYSSKDIESFVKELGAVPVIDFKADRNGLKQEMDPAKKIRYKSRTTVERTNSELKDCFLPPKLYSRGRCSLLNLQFSVLLLTIKKIRNRLIEEQKIQAA